MPNGKEVSTAVFTDTAVTPAQPLKQFRPIKVAIVVLVMFLIVGGPAGYFMYAQKSFDNTYNAARVQIQFCLDNALENAMLRTNVQGGRATPTDITFTPTDALYSAEYLHYNGVSRLISPEQLTEEIATYTTEQLRSCVAKISSDTVTITPELESTDITLGPETRAILNGRVIVQNRIFGRDINDVSTTVSADPRPLWGVMRQIVDHISRNQGITDVTILKKEGYDITFAFYPDQDTIVVLVRDNGQKIEDIPLAVLGAVDISSQA